MELVIEQLEWELKEKEITMTAWIIENDQLPNEYPELLYIKELKEAISILKTFQFNKDINSKWSYGKTEN